MQIHEVTQPSILGTIGKDIKSAVSAPFQKAAAVMSTPGAMTDPHAYRDAMQKYHAGQVAALEPRVQAKLAGQIAQRTQQRAQELAQKWTEYVKSKQPRPRLKSAPIPITPTGQYAAKPTSASTVDMQTGKPIDQLVPIKEQTSGAPTPGELAKYQQRIAAATAPKTGISALPGNKPPTGGTVDPKISAMPKTVLTGSRAQEFETWADQQLTSKIPGTNVVISIKQIKEKYPEVRQSLNTALTKIIKGNNDPRAVQEYLTTAMQGMQRYSAELKQSREMATTGSTRNPMSQGVLDRYVDPVTVQKLQSLVQNNPTYAAMVKKELGIT